MRVKARKGPRYTIKNTTPLRLIQLSVLTTFQNKALYRKWSKSGPVYLKSLRVLRIAVQTEYAVVLHIL